MNSIWIFVSISFVVGFLGGSFVMETLKDRQVHRLEKEMNAAIVKEYHAKGALEQKEEEFRSWQNTFDKRVEQRVAERLRDWTPSVEDADEAFRQAEEMAAKREAVNAGRSHPPRSDARPPAKLSRLRLRR